MLYSILLFAGWVVLLAGIRFITVLAHELGHAVSLLVMQDSRATVYIGSMGDPTSSLELHFKRLDIWIKYNPFKWNSGLCVPHTKELSVNKQLVFAAMGPVASLMMLIFPALVVKYSHLEPAIKMIFFFTAFSAFTDFFVSAFPRAQPIKLYAGGTVYNDASGIRQILLFKKLREDYGMAVSLYKEKNYARAEPYFEKFLKAGWRDEQMLRLAIYTCLQLKNNELATAFDQALREKGNMSADDFTWSGIIKTKNGNYREAINDFKKALKIDPDNKAAQEQLVFAQANTVTA